MEKNSSLTEKRIFELFMNFVDISFRKNKSAIIFPFTYFSGHNSSSIRVFSSRSNVTKKP